jgi:hypothetical protein
MIDTGTTDDFWCLLRRIKRLLYILPKRAYSAFPMVRVTSLDAGKLKCHVRRVILPVLFGQRSN